ncbi:MAG: UDP-glucose dehydrogenase family protein [Myxococcota bacterium]
MRAETLAPIRRISVIGLGKLGAVVAGCHASRGFDVIGVDIDARAVEHVACGKPPVPEPGIEELYAMGRARLTATQDMRAAVQDSDASLVVVPTPSDADGGYSLAHALRVCEEIGAGLSSKEGYHLVAMKSTVLPGACAADLIPALEEASGKRCGEDFGFCYSPEFIALGSVIHDIFHPDLVVLGESDRLAGDLVEGIYRRLLQAEPPLARMNLVNAELSKLAVNAYVTMKITFANSLARICERLAGGDVDAVTGALGMDSRIGPKYLKGGLGFGGPCFPRDNRAMLSLARRLGVPFSLAESTDATNLDPARAVVERVVARAPAGARVGVLGLSYKPDTPVVEQSQGVFIARLLRERGFQVTTYDPLAMDSARRELGDQVKYAESAQAAVDDHSAVVIATPWPEFGSLDYSAMGLGDPLVVDCWGILADHDGTGRVRLGAWSSR